jgi:hypothetical protein
MDGLAMAKAMKDVAGCQIDAQSLSSVLDLKTIWYRATNRVAAAIEIAELRARYAFHLRRQFLIRPSVVTANYPLVEHVNALQNREHSVLGLISATSAGVLQMKARSIGLQNDGLPIATIDDSETHAGILNSVQTRAKRSYGYQLTGALLVAGHEWKDAADQCDFELKSPSDYLTDEVVPAVSRSTSSGFFMNLNWAR